MEAQEMNSNKIGIDPFTGEEFVKKRNNQIFATRENQKEYNNQRAREKRKAIAKINGPLNNNRKVLQKVLGNQNEVIRSYDFLMGAGMHMGISTHRMQNNGVLWNCVFDYAYAKIGDDQFKIVRIQQEVG